MKAPAPIQHKKLSVYAQTLGSVEKRTAMISGLYKDLATALSKGRTGWVKKITNDLHALGEGDYSPKDHGEPPKGAQWN